MWKCSDKTVAPEASNTSLFCSSHGLQFIRVSSSWFSSVSVQSSLDLLALVPPASLSIKEASWLLNPFENQTEWKSNSENTVHWRLARWISEISQLNFKQSSCPERLVLELDFLYILNTNKSPTFQPLWLFWLHFGHLLNTLHSGLPPTKASALIIKSWECVSEMHHRHNTANNSLIKALLRAWKSTKRFWKIACAHYF